MVTALTATHPYLERKLPALGLPQRLTYLVTRLVTARKLPLLKRVKLPKWQRLLLKRPLYALPGLLFVLCSATFVTRVPQLVRTVNTA